MQHAWLLPAIPALAAVLGLLGNRLAPGGPAVPAIAGAAATLLVTCLIAADLARGATSMPLRYQDQSQITDHSADTSTSWTPIGGIHLSVGTHIDGLVVCTALMVAVVALVVQIYSMAYMAGDTRYGTYAAEVSLFTGAMLLVVVASSLFELLVGWELMGICSYLLIGHYHHDRVARDAAVKSFVVTRIGDVGFLFGIFVLGFGAKSFDIGAVNAAAGGIPHSTVVVGALLLLCGVVGKSAQFPLHVWLPDAMAGPTPISALIHAATMVAAGIFVVARMYPVFLAAPASLTVLGVIACITMLGAALAALAQDDLKRVLAWSTCSQLAYMGAALAVHGWTAGVYALLSHAAFKSLLFLAAGSVLHAVKTNHMSGMGGLRRKLPITFWTMVVGGLALAGVPPFDGGFSKDGVLEAAKLDGGVLGHFVYVVGLVTAFVTAAYVTRMILRTFFGEQRSDVKVREPSRLMTIPLIVLSLAVLGLGIPAVSDRHGVARWVSGPAYAGGLHLGVTVSVTATAVALAGVILVVLIWRWQPAEDPVRVLRRGLANGFANGFYVDALYDRAIVRPTKAIARAVVTMDDRGVDAAVVGAGRGATLTGGALRWLQNGNAQRYATGLILGVVAAVLAVSA
jgi:NADH-quinone oxidoreductase subunit L